MDDVFFFFFFQNRARREWVLRSASETEAEGFILEAGRFQKSIADPVIGTKILISDGISYIRNNFKVAHSCLPA